jgi:hypothetical protein
LPEGNKKIFVTDVTYAATELTSQSVANSKCTTLGAALGGGTYKALVALKGTDPITALPSGKYFWNGKKLNGGADCTWNLVADSPNDFFTPSGSDYIKSPIIYDQMGTQQPGVNVWTDFILSASGGSYSLVTTSADTSACHHSVSPASGADMGTWYMGNTSYKSKSWANYINDYEYITHCWPLRAALYCVEQ